MKLDFALPVLDLTNKPIVQEGNTLTMKDVAITALLTPHEADSKMGGDEKARQFSMAVRLSAAEGDLDLKAEELAMLKRLIGRIYAPLVVGRAFEFLDGTGSPVLGSRSDEAGIHVKMGDGNILGSIGNSSQA